MAKKVAYIFLTVLFLFSLTLSISAKENFLIRDKDTEKKLIELWNGDDAKAFEDFFSYYFEEDGGFAPRLFDPEIGQSFRNEEDKLIVLTFSFDREAMIASEYGEYYLEFEKEYPYNLGSFYFSLISYDGTTYNTERKNALNKKVYTFKEIIRECGIEDSSEIGLARFERLSSYGTFSFEFMDYTPGWNEIDGDRYYIKSDGTVLTKSATIDGIRYKFGKDGVCQGKYTGKVKSGNRIICYKNGVKQEDELFTGWLKAGEKRFYAEDGVIRTGWVNISPDWYYIDPKEGRLTGAERICVKVPDGTVYESADGGKSWTVGGKKTKTPTLSARFEEKRPAVFSEKSVLTIRNETGKEIDFGEVYELSREENGKWISAEMIGEWFSEDVLCILESGSERTTDVHTEIHAPIKGKYRYTVNLNDTEGNGYMISVEFWAVEE